METEPDATPPSDTFAGGIWLALGLHIVGLPLVAVILSALAILTDFSDLIEALLMVAFNFGWAQAAYMIPALIVLHVRGQRLTRNGLALIAGLGFLVTSGCWGLVAYGM